HDQSAARESRHGRMLCLVIVLTKRRRRASRARPAGRGRAAGAVAGKESRRKNIIEKAIRLMQEKGFAGMSVQQLADTLEFSKANVFYHLKSKEELLYHIFVENFEYTIRALEQIVGSDAGHAEKLRRIVAFYARMMIERSEVMTVWFREGGHLTPQHQKEVAKLRRRIDAALDPFYADAIAKGVIRPLDPRIVRTVVFGTAFNLTRWTERLEHLSIETIVDQVTQYSTSG